MPNTAATADDLDAFVQSYKAGNAPVQVAKANIPQAAPSAGPDDLDAFVNSFQKSPSSKIPTTPPTIGPRKQSLLERAKDVLTFNAPPGSVLGNASGKVIQPGDEQREPGLSFESAMTPTEQSQHPVATGVAELASGLTTPTNAMLVAGTGGFGELPGAAGRLIPRLLSAGFSVQMLKGAYDQYPEFKAAMDRGDYSEAKRIGTLIVGGVAMGAAVAKHATTGESAVGANPEPSEPPEQATSQTPTAQNPLQRMPSEHGTIVTPEPKAPESVPESEQTKATPENERAKTTTVQSTAPESLVHESPKTLTAQTEALANGTNKIVYFPKGTASLPEPPENAKVTTIGGDKPGAGTYYHDDSISPAQIRGAVKDGTYGQLLGHVQTKEEATAPGTTPTVVTARGSDSGELKASVVDGSKPDIVAAQAAALARQFPDAKITTETPEQTIAARQATPTKSEAATPEQPVSRVTPQTTEPEQQITDRRSPQNAALRQRVSEMTPEQMRQELLTSPVTGLPNRRAFDEQEQAPAVAMSDADGLKALNDKFGYEAGNALLKAKAEALKEAGLDAYHEKGDEFLYRGQDEAGLQSRLEEARNILRNRTIEVTMNDGSTRRFKGADFSYGTGTTLGDAEGALKGHKTVREAAGERARGELRGIAAVEPEEGKVNQSTAGNAEATEATQLAEGKLGTGHPVEAPNVSSGPENSSGKVGAESAKREESAAATRSAANSETIVPSKKQVAATEKLNAIMAEAYRPGTVVKGYAGNDKVLEFRPGDPAKPYPDNRWSVKVVASDKDGNPISGERPRWHTTEPNKADWNAAVKRLEDRAENARAVKIGDLVEPKTGKLKGKTVEVTKVGATGVYAKPSDGGPVGFVRHGDFEAFPTGHGPGTPLKSEFDSTGTRLDQLSDSINKQGDAATKSVGQRVNLGEKLAVASSNAKDAVTRGLAAAKGVASGMISALRKPAPWTDFDDALGKYSGAMNRSAFELRKFADAIKKSVPDSTRREAITNWVEAAGDDKTLQKWADASKGGAKKGYEAALTLSDQEKTIARNLMLAQDERFQIDKDAGLLEHEVENYVMHAWGRDNKYTGQVMNRVRTMMLETKPSFTKQRVFGTYFDGEQAGYRPVNKDVGFLFSAREHAANQAVAARAFIKSMFDGKASDGRPLAAVSGAGRTIDETDVPKAYLINPNAKPEEIGDYRPIDHPALRKWKWASTDESGKPIFVQGDMVIHPDAYKKLKNVLGSSALKAITIPGTEIQPFRAALRLGTEAKNTLLSLSAFHQTQEGLHAVFHRVNPFKTEPLDFSDVRQQGLIDHGLQVASFDSQEKFSEGVSASGLIQRIPVLGKYMQKYNDYLFSDYIPRLKMSMGLDALERNMKRYVDTGKLTKDQAYALTAREANAAFGELNYTMMARNKTFQDVLRTALLAPDFLEARGRFVGQALKPYGREQAVALAGGALGLYVAARAMNAALNKGNPQWDPEDAFNVVHNGKTYTLRSVPADIAHLLTDPRGFIYNRLNPLYGKGAIEGITGRDQYGRKLNAVDEAKDLGRGIVPIPFQGLSKAVQSSPMQTVLSSTGVSSFPYQSPAERLARKYTMDDLPLGPETEDRKQANMLARRYEDAIRAGKMTKDDVSRAVKDGKLSGSDAHRLLARAARTPLQNSFRSLSPEQALDVWDKATDDEKKQIRPLLANKMSRLGELPVQKRQALKTRMLNALHPSEGQRGAFGIPRFLGGSAGTAKAEMAPPQ